MPILTGLASGSTAVMAPRVGEGDCPPRMDGRIEKLAYLGAEHRAYKPERGRLPPYPIAMALKRGRHRLYRCLRYGAANLLEQANS